MAAITAQGSATVPQINRRRQGSLGGLLVTAIGASLLVSALAGQTKTAYLFIALGIAFALAYAQGRQPYVYLVATCTFLAFGVGMELAYSVAAGQSAVFLGTLAFGPFAVFLIRPARRWPLAITAVLAAAAITDALGVQLLPAEAQPLFVPAMLVVVGAYLIVGPRRS